MKLQNFQTQIDVVEQLIDEYQKDDPSEARVKGLMEELKIPYDGDSIAALNRVLETLNFELDGAEIKESTNV